jgi:phospholipid/cholesterol/gamma-HCH transport system substrate-binding protein
MLDIVTESAEPVASDLQSTIRKLNTVLDNLANNSQELDSIFRNLQRTPALLNSTITRSNAKIDELTASFKLTSEHLNETLTELKPTMRNLKVFTDSLKRMQLNQTMVKTQQALTKLSELVDKLGKGDNTASKLLTEDSLYVNLNNVLISVDSLARHFDSSPRDFLKPLGKSKDKLEKERKKKP